MLKLESTNKLPGHVYDTSKGPMEFPPLKTELPKWLQECDEAMRITGLEYEADMKLADEAEKQQKEQLRQNRIEATAKVKAWFEKHEKGSKKDRKKNRRKQC